MIKLGNVSEEKKHLSLKRLRIYSSDLQFRTGNENNSNYYMDLFESDIISHYYNRYFNINRVTHLTIEATIPMIYT